ncbi:MAG TPA: glycosyltransferase [Pyrinomonadaceae bacterium]|jgi:glycosyltransferase involved in cell wall biosynthesis|nr:glycosyltransferase [Pyrinomonadaceae bacterium]
MFVRSEPSLPAAPLVSVIVPTYNYGRFIGQMLESVLSQTYRNWECIVVDDGSNDDTREVVGRFAGADARIKYIHQENRGQPAALNTGLRSFAGEYLQILDSDDLIEARKLERQVEFLESHGEVDIVYGGVKYFHTQEANGRHAAAREGGGAWMPRVSGAGVDVLPALVRWNIMVVNSPLVRRSVVENVGFFDETLAPAQDWDYWLRCALLGKRFEFHDLAETLALVRTHPASSSHDKRRMYRVILLVREKIRSLTNDPYVLALNEERRIRDQESLAFEEIDHGGLGECLSQMVRAGLANRRAKHRAKWIACACVAPFLPRRRLKTLVSSSLTGFLPGG